MTSSRAGRMHEHTFNLALADALRDRRRAWKEHYDYINAERQGSVVHNQRLRPDILVAPPDIYPVIIEVEFGRPAVNDARAKLGKQVLGTLYPVRSTIAVGAPEEIRRWTDERLRTQLSVAGGIDLEFAVLSANIRSYEPEVPIQEGDVEIWPETGAVNGTVEDLADLCEYASAPRSVVETTADDVANQIKHLALSLHSTLPTGVAQDIASNLGQSDPEQGLRLACCIWLTSLRLQNLLAQRSSSLRAIGLQSTNQLRSQGVGSVLTPGAIRNEWDKILSVNYGAIFHAARIALDDRIPDDSGASVLDSLGQLVERIVALRLGNRVDFAGELFPLLLDDREETAAHYTLSETAELLGRLAVDRLAIDDWASSEVVDSLRVADMACGTGALLRASYGHIPPST